VSEGDASEVKRLERADRLEDAAKLALSLEDFAEAARLFERACLYGPAGDAALRAGLAQRAVELAARSGNADAEARAIEAAKSDPDAARKTAARLSDLGRPATAGRLLAAIGDHADAAAALERAAAWLDAAKAHEAAGDARRAARCLETAIDSGSEQEPARLLLGALLARHGRHAAAVKVLQAIAQRAPERARALVLLRDSFRALGLTEAEREVENELGALGATARVSSVPPPSRAEAEGGQVLFGRYRVEREVARTPTARVLEARDLLSDRSVAVKLFSAATLRDAGRDALVRFEREAVVLGQLRHPSIVPLVAFVPEGPAVVLDWMGGGSLADQLATTALSPARAVEVACSVLSALAEAHRRGILHRDIKPANVLFDAAGAAYLADFGTAHVADAAQTVTSGVIGTLAYMAPEQRAGSPANAKSDIYGVGALLVHTLTGAPPGGRLPYLSDELTPDHVALVERLVGEEALRPDSATEARELLRSVPWPTRAPAPRETKRETTAAPTEETLRLERLSGARFRDRVLDREIYVLDAKGSGAERALAFARADHPGLASILVMTKSPDALWIEAPRGTPVSGSLGPEERAEIADALAALHRAGGWHGAVDRNHVLRAGGRWVLAFPLEPHGQDPASDFAGLAALGENAETSA